MKKFFEKIIEGVLTCSGFVTSITILLIVLFLFTEAFGLFKSKVIEEGYVLALNKSNKVSVLSPAQIKNVFDEEITNWKELGGDDKSIVVIGREDGSGTRDGFESIVMGDKEPKYAQELESTGSVINAVATTDGAIGYASLANVDETVKALKIGGIEATEENVKSGAYEVQRPFICATLKGSDNKLVKAYLDFILSEEGQALVLAQGAVPVK